jgi:hypothetical protein
MKVELNEIIKTLTNKYNEINDDYIDECARDFMSRRATYLDGQCAILHEIIDMLNDINEDAVVDELVESMFSEEEIAEDFAYEDDVDEVGYNPYIGERDMDC